MKAVIMAGGEGTRLRPLTLGRPKPMIPLVNKPVLSHSLDLLKRHGITDVVITVQYLAQRIKDYYGDGEVLGMNIAYSEEPMPLGTAGGVRHAAEFLDESFLVLSGDALTDFDLGKLIAFHRERGALATMTLARVANPLEYGVVQIDSDGRVVRIYEKPGWSEVLSDTVNTGIYVLEPEILDRIDRNVVCDFSHDLFPALIEEGAPFYGHVAEGYWTDIGQIEEYVRATADVLEGRVQVEPMGEGYPGPIWMGGEVEIAPDAQLYGPIYLGSGVKIKGGVTVRGPAVIRDNTVVDTGANIERSIIWRNCYVGERAEIRGAIIGLQSSIKAQAMLFEGVVISDTTLINENAVIQPNVRIWPDKQIESGATVSSNLVWGAQGRRNLFGRYGITGMVNVELTPEFCTKVGAAFGTLLPKRAAVLVNREAHNTPRVLKRAVLSGLPTAGVDVRDTGTQPVPVARFYTRESDIDGGVHVRLSPYDNRVVDIKIFDSDGFDVGQRVQRSMETIFFREDFRRVYLDEIGQIAYPMDVAQRYEAAFVGALRGDLWPLSDHFDHVVIDYANASTALVLPDLLNRLKCDVVAVNTLIEQNLLFRTRPEWEQGMVRLGAISRALDANFGVRLDVGGERAFFTANDGSLIADLDAALAVAALVFRVQPGAVIGVPAIAPRQFERLAEQFGGQVRRVGTGQMAQMSAAGSGEFRMIADTRGGFIFPDFTPFPDGMFAIAKIMELTAQAGITLSDIWRERSPYYLRRSRLACGWEAKGRVMRLLAERFPEGTSASGEGIQLELDGEWVLFLSDPDEPSFWIHAEGYDSDRAADLVDRYGAILGELIDA